MSFHGLKVARMAIVGGVFSLALIGAGAFFFGGLFHGARKDVAEANTDSDIESIREFLAKGPEVLIAVEEVAAARKENSDLRKKLDESDKNVKDVQSRAASKIESLGAGKAMRAVENLRHNFGD